MTVAYRFVEVCALLIVGFLIGWMARDPVVIPKDCLLLWPQYQNSLDYSMWACDLGADASKMPVYTGGDRP